ncbi:MAG: hypothetical protein RR623_06130 [Bacilli bacterium]
MNKKLIKYAKRISGNILSIGFSADSKLLKLFKENKKTKDVFVLTNKGKKGNKKVFNNKSVKVKKIYKHFKKENIDYTFLEYSSVLKHLKTLIKNSIDLTNKEVILFLDNKDVDISNLIQRYERYKCTVKNIDNDFLIIDVENKKTNIIKNIIFYIKDILYETSEALAFLIIGS